MSAVAGGQADADAMTRPPALGRFLALRACLKDNRQWPWSRQADDRLAAILAMRDAAAPPLAEAMNAAAETLARRRALFDPLRDALARRFAAALLAARGLDPEAFAEAYDAARARLREAGLRRGGPGEAFVVLLHFLATGGQGMSAAEARALRNAWRTLKRAQFWTAGTEHFPFLAPSAGGEPQGHVRKALAVYAEMKACGLSPGAARLASALFVAEPDPEPPEIAARYRAIHDAFRAQKLPVGAKADGAIAALCRLPGEPAALAAELAGLAGALRAARPRVSGRESLASMLMAGGDAAVHAGLAANEAQTLIAERDGMIAGAMSIIAVLAGLAGSGLAIDI